MAVPFTGSYDSVVKERRTAMKKGYQKKWNGRRGSRKSQPVDEVVQLSIDPARADPSLSGGLMFERLLMQLPKDNVELTLSNGGQTHGWPLAREGFWDECGSGYFGGLALYVFGSGYREAFHDIDKWNKDALKFYRWLVPKRYVAFAEDAFGTQFFYDATEARSPVYSLIIQDALILTVAGSIEMFFEDLLDEDKRDMILNDSFYVECLTNDIDHQAGRHLTLRVPRCLGGNESMGLVDVDAVTNATYLGQLLQQAQDLTPAELASRVRLQQND